MGDFLAFVTIVFAAGWGSAFLVHFLKRHSQRLDRTADQETLARLLEEMDQISNRLTHLEEKVEFFKDLRGPTGQARLAGPAEEVGVE